MFKRIFICFIFLNNVHNSFSMYLGKTSRKLLTVSAVSMNEPALASTQNTPGLATNPEPNVVIPPIESKTSQYPAKTKAQKRALFKTMQENEAGFHKMPTEHNRLNNECWTDEEKIKIAEFAKYSSIVMDQRVHEFLGKYLQLKKEYGHRLEQEVYADLNKKGFAHRLICQRPLTFVTKSDQSLLRDGHTLDGKQTVTGGYETIGTEQEQEPLTLKNYISYEEMPIAALLSIASGTFFINNGDRNNAGRMDDVERIQREGIYAGVVGARYEKPDQMECKYQVVTPTQNTLENGYGIIKDATVENRVLQLWEWLYEMPFATYQEAQNDTTGRFVAYYPNKWNQNLVYYFDTQSYKKRMELVIKPFLLHSDHCAQSIRQAAYIHAVGLGLGVWQIHPSQANLMLDVYHEVIENNALDHTADIDFSWFPDEVQQCGDAKNGEKINDITIHFSHRNPADKLTGEDEGKLLIAQYAWDGNSYTGNEYWRNMLIASGDPAAASCSLIPSLHNPDINPRLKQNYIRFYPYESDRQ